MHGGEWLYWAKRELLKLHKPFNCMSMLVSGSLTACDQECCVTVCIGVWRMCGACMGMCMCEHVCVCARMCACFTGLAYCQEWQVIFNAEFCTTLSCTYIRESTGSMCVRPEQITQWARHGQMQSPWSFVPHFRQMMSDVHYVCVCPDFWHIKQHIQFSRYDMYLEYGTMTHLGKVKDWKERKVIHVHTSFPSVSCGSISYSS